MCLISSAGKKGTAMRLIYKLCVSLLVITWSVSATAATLASARQHYDAKDYKAAAAEYKALLALNWPKSQVGGLYDTYTECLVITGDYDLAEAKIDRFMKLLPGDPLESKMAARKIQIAHDRGEYAQAVQLAGEFVTKYSAKNGYSSEVRRLSDASSAKIAAANVGSLASATAESARQNYERKAFRDAAEQYGTLLGQESVAANRAEYLDRLTECLAISGQYGAAREKIDGLLKELPNDPLAEKLSARKVRVAVYANDFTSASQLARNHLAKYGASGQLGIQVQKLLVDSLAKDNKPQEQVDFVEQALAANPTHPAYAELRRAQADTLSYALRQAEPARIKYADALQHSTVGSELYEVCAFRISDILSGQAKVAVKTDTGKADELSSQSLQYLAKFVDSPGAVSNYPANAKRRVAALKRLGRYDEMEREAARYLGDDNVVNYNEVVAIKNILGEFSDFQDKYATSLSAVDRAAIKEIKAAYYSEKYADANRIAREFLKTCPAGSSSHQLAQRVLIGSMTKGRAGQELVDYVNEALSADSKHPMYADFRRAQADALWDLKKTSDSQAMFVDAMAHSSNDSDVYEWCCYRAGAALLAQAAKPGIDPTLKAELRANGRKFLREYVELPSKDRIYPANIKRRMMAYNSLGQNDQMELEAARYLADRGGESTEVYMQIMSMLSYNRSMRKNSDPKGAMAAFDELRARENEFSDANSKVSVGISMLKSANWFNTQATPKDQVEQLRETGRRFLRDAAKDESIKLTRRLDAYYFLQDWASLKATASKAIEQTAASDVAMRAELYNWTGIALANQNPRDIEGAVASFEKSLQEYDKNPQLVKERGTLAAYWALWLRAAQKDNGKARVYFQKINTMPDCETKTKVLTEYQYLAAGK